MLLANHHKNIRRASLQEIYQILADNNVANGVVFDLNILTIAAGIEEHYSCTIIIPYFLKAILL